MIKDYLEIGKITSTHGIKGEVRVEPWCDSPEFLKRFKVLYFDAKGEKPFKIMSRPHGHMAIGKIEGIDTVEEASKLRNKVIYMKRSDAKLPKGKYFIAELIDCKVIDADDEKKVYGTLSDVSETGANDVYVVEMEDKKELLIPAIKQCILNVDVENGQMEVHLLEGLL